MTEYWVMIGRHTAFKWFANGCRSLEDLRRGKGGVSLSPAQQIGLDYYDGGAIFNATYGSRPHTKSRHQLTNATARSVRYI